MDRLTVIYGASYRKCQGCTGIRRQHEQKLAITAAPVRRTVTPWLQYHSMRRLSSGVASA